MRRPKKQYRSSAGGSFMLDRMVRGVGRIHKASGLTVEAQFNALNTAIPELAKSAEGMAALRALKDGTITGLQLFVAVKHNNLASLGTSADGATLIAALEAWREDFKRSVALSTYRGRGELIRHVRAVAKPTTRVSDLPKVLRKLKVTMPSAREFNLELQYASAFVRDTLGRRHEVYLDVRDIDVRPVTKQPAKAALSPADVKVIADTFARVWKSKKGSRGAEVYAMVLTGMGATEYWGRWHVLPDRVHIDGLKRPARTRDIPRLFPCALFSAAVLPAPAITPSSFARALTIVRVASGIDCAPYDLRRTFVRWLGDAGIPRWRCRMYMGHAVGDVTEIYERSALDEFLRADGATARAWIDASIESANERHTEPDPKP